jgi:hypothetical protein
MRRHPGAFALETVAKSVVGAHQFIPFQPAERKLGAPMDTKILGNNDAFCGSINYKLLIQ